MSEQIEASLQGQAVLREMGWERIAEVFATPGGKVYAKSGTSSTVCVPMGDGSSIFLKRYDYPQFAIHHLLRASRPKREWRSLKSLADLGVLVPEPVAWGEERRLRRLRRGFVVTRAIDGGVDLETYFSEHPCPDRSVVAGFARAVAAMHDGAFCHGDLYLRNVILERRDNEEPRFFFIDAPKGRRRRQPMRRGRAEDLANLDLDASRFCNAPMRWRFLRHYLHAEGKRPDPVSVRLLLEDIQKARLPLKRVADQRAARRAARKGKPK